MSKRHDPISQFRGFLGNGGWMISVHTKKCARQRRNVASAQRVREMFPNPQGANAFRCGA